MKMRGINVETKEQGARINWGQIMGKAANGAKTMFEPIMPATVNTISGATGVMRDIRNATRATRSATRKQNSEANNSTDNKRSLNLFKSAFDDIQSGNFTMEKINDDLYDDYESDTSGSFKMPSGDDAVEMSSEEILLMGNRGVAQSIIQSSSAQLRGLQESSKALIKSNIKSTQALGLSINNTLRYGFNSINTNLTIQNQKLDSINKNISGLLAFNNKNALEFYTKSIDMMAGIGKMMENLDKSMNPSARKKDRVFDTSNGFNIRNYIEYVKEGFKESLVGTGVSVAKSSGKDFGIIGAIMDFIVPKSIKEPLQKFDKSLTRFFNEGFKRLGEKLNKNDLFQALGLGEIFGSKRSKVNGISLGNYMKDATPWNGIAQKALVEVIPELLTSIDSKIDKSEKRYYDYDKGQFKTRSRIKEDFRNEYFDTFSTMLRDSMDKLTKVSQATGRTDSNRLIATIEGLIDDHLSGSKDTMQTRTAMVSEMKKFGISETGIREFIEEFTDGLDGAISKINDLYHTIGSTQHIYRNINNTDGREYTKTIKNIHGQRKTNYRSFSFLSNYGLGGDPKAIIQELQRKANITDVDVSDDVDLQDTIYSLMQIKAKESELLSAVRKSAATKRITSKVKKKNKFTTTIKNKTDAFGSTISSKSESILNPVFKKVYLDPWGNEIEEPAASDQTTKKGRVKVAVSRMSKARRGSISSREERDFKQLNDLNKDGYDKFINKSESENDRDHNTVANALGDLSKSGSASTVEEAISQSNNSLKSFLSALMINFKGFTSRLFGKEGFFRKLWDSEARKKATDKLKEKLFTGEKAIFKKPYEGAKAGLKNLKDKTLGYLGKGYDFLYDNTMQYMYGEKDEDGRDISYKDSERWKKNTILSQTLNREWRAEQKKAKGDEAKSGIKESTQKMKTAIVNAVTKVEEGAENLGDSVEAFVETTVGDSSKSPDTKKKAYTSEFMKKMKSTMPKALAGAVAGAGVGLLNNSFSLLGSMFLPGGPIAGAIVGGGLTILSQTEAFKKFMFGKLSDPNDPNSAREGGLISNKMKEKFKQMLPFAVGGGVLGAIKGLAKGALGFDGGLGVLGTQILPGGIIGGAMLGAGIGILKNSEGFKNMLFGEKGEDGKRSGKFLSNSFNKVKAGFSKMMPGLKKAGAGLGLGALTGAVLSSAGYLPAMLSLGGPVGMGIAGLGLGIASSTKKFNEWMFGSEELDENGNPTGKRRKDGMLTRVTNILRTNVVEPIADTFKTKMLDLVDWTKDKVTYPFRLAVGPILDSLLGIKDNVVDFVKDKFEVLGNGIMDMMKKTMKTLFSPVTKIIGFVGKSMLSIASAGAKVAMAPLSLGLQAMQLLTAGKRRKEYVDFYKNYYSKGNIMSSLNEKWDAEADGGKKRNIFGKISDTIGAYIGHGEIADAARSGWNEQMAAEGKNHLNWRGVTQERRAMHSERDKRRANEKQWRKIDAYRSKIINKDLNGREVTLNDYQFERYRDRFKKLGISEEYLQSSDDIMDLLYRKNEFKKRLDPTAKSGGLVIEETPEQKAAREKTEQYQEHIKSVLDKVAERMGIAAKDLNEKKAIRSATEEWNNDKKKLARRMKRAGVGNINLNAPELQDFDINEVDSDRLFDYKNSEFAKTGDFLGFLKASKVTQKSTYKSGNKSIPDVKATEVLTEIKDTMKEQTELSRGQLEATAGVDIPHNKKFSFRDMSKFNIFKKLLGFNKKKTKTDAEKSESEAAREGTDLLAIEDGTTNTETTPEKGIFGKAWDKIKSIGKLLGASKVGGFLLKGAKFAGTVGLLGGIGFTIAELIRPGTADKVGAKIDAFTEYVTADDFTLKKVFTDFSNWFNDTFIGKWWSETVTPWWKDKAWPAIKKVPEIIITELPNIIRNTGKLISENADTIVNAMSLVVTEIGVPLVKAIAKGTPEILGAVLEGSYEIIKSLGNEILYALGLKNKPKEDISATSKASLEGKGTNVATESVGAVSAGTYDEAVEKAKKEYGLTNPQLAYNPNTGKYEISKYVVTGRNTARDATTGETVNVGGLKSDQLAGSTAKLAAYGLGDAAFNLYGGRGLKGTRLAQRGLQTMATAGGTALQGAGWLGKKTLGKLPIVGIPFKAVGAGVEGAGKLVAGAAHPIQTTKAFANKLNDNKLVNGLFGTKEFRASKAAANVAADTVSDAANRYAKNAAGRWYDIKTGKFVKAEVAEAAIKSTDNVIDAATNIRVRDRGLIHNLMNPIDSIKTGISNIGTSLKAKGNALLHPIDSLKKWGSDKLSSFKGFANKILGSKSTTSEVVEEGSEAILNKTLKSSTEQVTESAVKKTQQSSLEVLLKKISKWLGELADNKTVAAAVSKMGSKSTDSIMTKISKYLVGTIDTILANSAKCLKKLTDLATAAIAKITGKLGLAAGTFGIAEVVSIGVGGVFGAIDAANLFETKDPDWIMRGVSTIIEALLSTSIGAGIDFLFEAIRLIGDISGKDWNFKRDLAEFLYKLLCGYSDAAIEKLKVGQDALKAERDVYNALNDTNLSTSAYNEEANKTVFGKTLDGGKKVVNWTAKLFGKKGNVFKVTDTSVAEKVRKQLLETINPATNKKYTDADISAMASNGTLDAVIKSLGYGPVNPIKINGLYAQGDPRWAKMPIGRLPDGSIATMDRAGCGPTALAAVANTVAKRSVGYGPLTPADMAAYAASNGYITDGGANAGLFTDGAAKLGLTSHPISNLNDLRNNLLAGKPAILTGKSGNSSTPYTSAGHIVMADGMRGNKIEVLDPITGKRKLYDMNSVSKNTDHAWAYSVGYGPYFDALSKADRERAIQIANGTLDISRSPFTQEYKAKLYGAAQEILDNPALARLGTAGITIPTRLQTSAGNAIKLDNNAAITSNTVDYDTEATATGITNAEELRAAAQNESFLGKLGLIGQIASAKINSMLGGNDFWTEFGAITAKKNSDIESTDSQTDVPTISNGVVNMLKGTDRDRFIAAAKSQIGYLEKRDSSDLKSFGKNAGNNHYTKYAQEIGGWNGNTYGPAHWCNFFTSWAGKAAGIPNDIIYRNGSCTTTMNHYKGKGLFKTVGAYKGNPGDLVFFNWDKRIKNSANHIGIVTGSSGNELYTIEGNTSNGSGFDAVASKARKFTDGTIIGFATPQWTNTNGQVNPSSLLSLGYGPKNKLTKIDSPAYREQVRKSIEKQEEFKVTPKDFEAIGFGPGMSVDAGFDMTSTDGKLDQIVGIIAEWFAESKKSKAADSSATTNVNMIKANTTNVAPATTSKQNVDNHKYRDNIINQHMILSSKMNIRNTM